MGNIKISKEVEEAYDYLIDDYGITDLELVTDLYNGNYDKHESHFRELYIWWSEDAEHHTDIMKLILGDYEIDYTKEEKLKQYYDKFWNHKETGAYERGIIESVLMYLELEIDGINKNA